MEDNYVMDSSKITLIGNSKHLKIFLSKNYGLMLLFILEELAEKKTDNGIDDTYEFMLFYKPKRAAFSQFCALLRDTGVIDYTISANKKSKRILRLSKTSQEELQEIRKHF